MIKIIKKNYGIKITYIKTKNIFLVYASNILIYTYNLKKIYIKNLGIITTNYIILLRILRQFGLIKTILNKLEF